MEMNDMNDVVVTRRRDEIAEVIDRERARE
jgi:hypothetical protein